MARSARQAEAELKRRHRYRVMSPRNAWAPAGVRAARDSGTIDVLVPHAVAGIKEVVQARGSERGLASNGSPARGAVGRAARKSEAPEVKQT